MSRRRAPQIATEQEAIQRFVASKEGGLINLAEGGEFSGMVPGQGGGICRRGFHQAREWCPHLLLRSQGNDARNPGHAEDCCFQQGS